jgi:MoaA/NifB/PqqE/SkfB family radical SAM enzyme
VTLTGGEPLLFSNFQELVIELGKMKIPYNINTNGTLLTNKIVKLISKSSLKSISISLDSPLFAEVDGIRNLHKKAIEGLKLLLSVKKRKFSVRVVCVLTKKNYMNADLIYKSIKKIGVDDFCFQPVYIPKQEKDIYNKLSLYNLDKSEKIKLFKELLSWAKNEGYILYLDFLKKYIKNGNLCSICKNTSSFWCNVDGDIYSCFVKLNKKIGDLNSSLKSLYFANDYQEHIKQAGNMSCFSEKCFCAFLGGLKTF